MTSDLKNHLKQLLRAAQTAFATVTNVFLRPLCIILATVVGDRCNLDLQLLQMSCATSQTTVETVVNSVYDCRKSRLRPLHLSLWQTSSATVANTGCFCKGRLQESLTEFAAIGHRIYAHLNCHSRWSQMLFTTVVLHILTNAAVTMIFCQT